MRLEELKIENFKNYESARLALRERVHCFAGLNGSGKTNLLDAIYVLCAGKSYFNAVDQQLIRMGENYFSLFGKFLRKNETEDVRCVVMKGRKKVIKRNEETYARLVDHYGEFPAVVVAPGDVELITGGSEERRKWLDSTISLEDRDYLYALMRYEKVLQQRNAELRKLEEGGDRQLLEVLNSMLVPLAEQIYKRRVEFLEQFLPYFQAFHERISQGYEPVKLVYESSLHTHSLFSLFESNFRKDVLLQRTTAGIHRDDLGFTIHDQPLKRFGSQGQQKTYLLALKLAQHQYVKSHKGITPLLLLDDVCERLDETRLSILFDVIGEGDFGQVFITDSNVGRITDFTAGMEGGVKVWTVENGTVRE